MTTKVDERYALKLRQNGTDLYMTVWKGRELRARATVPHYDPDTGAGYQRKPKASRVRKAAKHLQRSTGGTFPTSILVNCREPLEFKPEGDAGSGQLGKLRIPKDATLYVVDGQTRLEGLEYAIQEDGRTDLNDFPVSVVIANFTDELTEMMEFRTINGEAKSVPTDLTDRLIAEQAHQTSSQEELIRQGNMKVLRTWKSVEVSKLLDSRPDSPWKNSIRPPNEVGDADSAVTERSMTTSMKDIIRRMETLSANEIAGVLINYWKAVHELCPEAAQDREGYQYLWNTTGIYIVHMLFPAVYERTHGDTSVKNFAEILGRLDGFGSELWVKDGDLKGIGGIGGFKKVANDLIADLVMARA